MQILFACHNERAIIYLSVWSNLHALPGEPSNCQANIIEAKHILRLLGCCADKMWVECLHETNVNFWSERRGGRDLLVKKNVTICVACIKFLNFFCTSCTLAHCWYKEVNLQSVCHFARGDLIANLCPYVQLFICAANHFFCCGVNLQTLLSVHLLIHLSVCLSQFFYGDQCQPQYCQPNFATPVRESY